MGQAKKKTGGEWIRSNRKKLGLTGDQLAERLGGVLPTQIRKWETGVDNPGHDNTRKLEKFFREELERQTPVLPSVGARTTEGDMEQELLRLFRELSALDKAKLLVDLAGRGERRSQEPAAPSKA